ncbi:hypothetical protein KP509_13G073500 [Ceratopteris richardii]|uniref:NF-X1-type domain-containing protein n=1 Tax=Ceratopteris richardii TaxID=49495 RepID=A0A8T2TEK6_CERRI|nr:hypothetical protein KP509_13G073500 [Ceratopteris richardii]
MHLTRSQASPWRQPPPSRPSHADSRNLSKEAFPVLANSPPSTEDDDNSGSDEENQGLVHVDTLELNIFRGYADARNGCHERADMPSSEPALAKIRDLLVASNLKAISCLICLEKVRQSDPIWHCTTGCHAIYHLICIQAWAGEACKVAEDRARARLSLEHFPAAVKDVTWHCPKCRIEYSREQIPRESLCYCGKVVDPPVDPWLTAHSCGQICGRSLSGGCGHECKLLCHPGACPPCPQFVKTFCFCGGIKDVRRCSHKHFSCGKKCSKELACGLHACEDICHGGVCPPCLKSGIHKCRCGRVEEVRVCSDSIFSCKKPCGKPMKCQKHWCKKVCHQGPCGECELQGKQRCPCGKVAYKELPCDSIAPTCGSTCEKPLPCSLHRCQERCHIGECKTVCRIVTLKVCRCGSLRKEVPCHQDLQCERKCQLLRDCRRHPCKRRCCNGDCPPCSEICGRKLRCGNHKCPAPCHRGPCAPCPLAVRISCACGSTAYEVPCGAERGKRPPRCLKLCPIIPRCSHRENSKPHRCHYGACPPCSLTCNEELLCGHTCKEICHGPRPPANPEFSLKQTKKRKDQTGNASLSGTPCPPCAERILMYCLGRHPGGERVMVCSESSLFSCGRLCGNILACGNHRCQKTCHDVAIPRNAGYEAKLPGNMDKIDSCEKCTLTCQKIRTPPCPHPCMQQCHVGTCSPCSAPLKRSCHCGTLSHSFPCSSFNNFIQEERDKRLSCGGPCHRKLPNCSHLCSEICHPGPCKMATNCQKKVSVWCKCERLKKEWFCSDVQVAFSSLKLQNLRGPKGVGLLSCDKECLKLIEEQRIKEDTERIRQRASIVSEEPPKKVGRRKRHYGSHAMTEKSRFKVWIDLQDCQQRILLFLKD